MGIIVQKYGGTSMGSPEKIKNVAKRVARWHRQGHQVVVVVSAMSGETNRLCGLIDQISSDPLAREVDVVLSTGEQVSIGLLAMALNDIGVQAKSFTGSQVKILTNHVHTQARIEQIDVDRISSVLNQGHVVIVAGFQGVDSEGNITTLGRGGSDTSGVALAAALHAEECQIYTDVDGVYTADPRIEPRARKLDHITFEEMLELSSLGSKVLQIRSVEFAGKYQVKLRILSSFQEYDAPNDGTYISFDDNEEDQNDMEQPLISGVTSNRDEAKLTLKGTPDQPGVAFQILDAIAKENIVVDMIIQNTSNDGTTDFSFTVPKKDYRHAFQILDNEIKPMVGATSVSGDENICKVSVVGVGMRSHPGLASKMFKALSDEGINIMMISTSEIKISIMIEEKYLELAVRSLHEAFGLGQSQS